MLLHLRKVYIIVIIIIIILPFRAQLTAYRNSQAMGRIGTESAGLYHSHSNTRSELCLEATPQLTATLDP